jgi:hypothetical protein
MTAMSDYLANALVDHTFGGAAFTQPADHYVALYTVAPTASTPGTEVVGGSYARQPVTFIDGAGDGQRENDAAVVFADMPAVTVVASAVLDAVTAGNMLVHGNLGSNRTMAAGETLTAEAGSLIVTLQ